MKTCFPFHATRLDGAARVGVVTDPVRIRKVLAGPFLLLLLDVPFDEIPLCEKREEKRLSVIRQKDFRASGEMFFADGYQRGDGRPGTFEAVGARAGALEVGQGK